MGGRVCVPYTGRYYGSRRETDIKHIVTTSEAHDSGLCAANTATKRRFPSDMLNLTLAAPAVNRYQKSGKDAGEWIESPRESRGGSGQGIGKPMGARRATRRTEGGERR